MVEKEPGQLVATVEEAAAISQLTPLLPQEAPGRWKFGGKGCGGGRTALKFRLKGRGGWS